MAPHTARLLGSPRISSQLVLAAGLGALIMIYADWLGRNLLFPYQLPAGLIASLLGSLHIACVMFRKKS